MNRVLAVLAASMLTTLSVSAGETPARPQAVAIRAYPFDSQTGQVSATNVLSPGGEGLSNDTTLDALVLVVEVAGPPAERYWRPGGSKYNVRLTGVALEGGTRVFTSTRPLDSIYLDGKRYVSFLLYDRQCVGMTLTARVLGPGRSEPVEALASFRCGGV